MDSEEEGNEGGEDVVAEQEGGQGEGHEEDEGQGGARKPPHKYTSEEDIAMFKEVVMERPFGKKAAAKWQTIFGRLEIPVKDGAALKRRYDLLRKSYDAKRWKPLQTGGLPAFNTKKSLLHDIKIVESSVLEEEAQAKDTASAKEKKKLEQGKAVRDAAMISMKEPSNDKEETTPKSSKVRTPDFLSLIKASDEAKAKQKEEQLQLESRRVALLEREMTLKENEQQAKAAEAAHLRKMEIERLELEKKKAEDERQAAALALEEKKMFLKLLQGKVQQE